MKLLQCREKIWLMHVRKKRRVFHVDEQNGRFDLVGWDVYINCRRVMRWFYCVLFALDE